VALKFLGPFEEKLRVAVVVTQCFVVGND